MSGLVCTVKSSGGGQTATEGTELNIGTGTTILTMNQTFPNLMRSVCALEMMVDGGILLAMVNNHLCVWQVRM